jgi:CspA family cold shock protein
MATGTIKTIQEERGFGFITPDDASGSGELFFHHSAVRDGGFEQLRVGQRVEFEEGRDPRNPNRSRANDVAPLES